MISINELTATKLIESYKTGWREMTPFEAEAMYKIKCICQNALNVSSYLNITPDIIIPSELVTVMSTLADEGKL